MKTTKKFLLPDQEIPTAWYNVLADMPPLQPMLNPATKEPVKPSDLEPLFAKGLIEQEFSTERWIPIPEEVRTLYKIYRPTPLVRASGLEKALDTLKRAQDALDEVGFAEITLCPETMGKIGQLGTLEEELALCGVDRRITPCIDFGHLNARTLGGIRSKADYAAILDCIGEALGDARARQFHVHFSRIEYSKGGEKRHWTFAETQFGPEPQPLMELLAERGLAPVIICESAGTQAEDAKTMKRFFEACLCTTSQSGLRPPAPLVGEPLA